MRANPRTPTPCAVNPFLDTIYFAPDCDPHKLLPGARVEAYTHGEGRIVDFSPDGITVRWRRTALVRHYPHVLFTLNT